jgi:hypothetical protein
MPEVYMKHIQGFIYGLSGYLMTFDYIERSNQGPSVDFIS